MTLKIVRRAAGADCASNLAELPEWFGLPDSNAAYTALAERERAWVAEDAGDTLGLMILADPGFSAIDIHLLAVRRHAHRRGVGRALVRQACAVAKAMGKTYVTVKTRGPSRDYEPYRRTRAFYDAVGFTALEEFTAIWGPENPCLIMIMPVPG
ncbi:MAG TPA: GNAT family N-acetyltransferase [Rhizomicrobium sp.]|nr:GNAT family N-acetyltransferase [Rhizomicrobium sp.]